MSGATAGAREIANGEAPGAEAQAEAVSLALQATACCLAVAAAQVQYYLHMCSHKTAHGVAAAMRFVPLPPASLGNQRFT